MITGKFIDTETRTIGGRHYIVRTAYEIEKGEAIWTQTDNGFELWHIEKVNPNTKNVPITPITPNGITGFIGFECQEGTIMHDANGGVYVDIKRGK